MIFIYYYIIIGGLGEAVAGALTEGRNNVIIKRLSVPRVARSGPGNELMKMYGIDSTAVIAAVKELLKA